jgi:ankyrin repeat protein
MTFAVHSSAMDIVGVVQERLCRAIAQFDNDAVQSIVEKYKNFINVSESKKSHSSHLGEGTPLHLAAYHGNAMAAFYLLTAGADCNAISEASRRTPLHMAGSKEVVNVLMRAGACVNQKDGQGHPPIYTIFDYLPSDAKADDNLTLRRCEAASQLIGFAENVNNPIDNDNNTLLHKAVRDVRHAFVKTKFLLDNGAHHSLFNNKGETAYELVFYGRPLLFCNTSKTFKQNVDNSENLMLKGLLDDSHYNKFNFNHFNRSTRKFTFERQQSNF